MLVSVAICTWNRAQLLDQTLAQMRHLRIPTGVKWELLIVNNNCTDVTDAVANRYAPHLPLRLLHEPVPGKSNAANLAVREARGELLLWTDDDVLVDPEWLASYHDAACSCPDASYFAGNIDPWFVAKPPRWVRRHLRSMRFVYAISQSDLSTRPLRSNEVFLGANMAIRTSVMQQFCFDPKLGPAPNDKTNGEDTDLCVRLRQAGHKGLWVGKASVRHFIPPERFTRGFVYLWYAGQGRLLVRRGTIARECNNRDGVPRWLLRRYWEERIKSGFLGFFKGQRWFEAFTSSARLYGAIQEIKSASAEHA